MRRRRPDDYVEPQIERFQGFASPARRAPPHAAGLQAADYPAPLPWELQRKSVQVLGRRSRRDAEPGDPELLEAVGPDARTGAVRELSAMAAITLSAAAENRGWAES